MSIIIKDKTYRSDDNTSNQSVSPKILVVDDDFTSRNLVFRMIEEIGFWVESAHGGIPAKVCLNQSKYDVLITDLQMPDLDGYTLSCWLKHKAPDIKVVIMTSCGRSEVADYVNTNVVDDWIFKPVGLDDLTRILSKLMPAGISRKHPRN